MTETGIETPDSPPDVVGLFVGWFGGQRIDPWAAGRLEGRTESRVVVDIFLSGPNLSVGMLSVCS